MKKTIMIALTALAVLLAAGCPGPATSSDPTPAPTGTPGPSANADLASLSADAGSFEKAFDPATLRYELTVAPAATSVTLTAAVSDSKASLSISPSATIAVSSSMTKATVKVTAESGATKTYTVVVYKPDRVDTYLGNMMLVPAGTFYRVKNPNGQPVQATYPFRMSQTEVTRAQWRSIMGDANDPTDTAYSSGSMQDPVQRVSWYDAITFCNKLSIAEGLTPVYAVSGVDFATIAYADIPHAGSADATWDAATADWTANGFRLPTQMEWLWAAIGAQSDGYGKAFAGSDGTNKIGDYAVFGANGTEEGHTPTFRSNPVRSRYANELGLYDMSGNVYEWCWDFMGDIPTTDLVDYRGSATYSAYRLCLSEWFYVSSSYLVLTTDQYRERNPYKQIYTSGLRIIRL